MKKYIAIALSLLLLLTLCACAASAPVSTTEPPMADLTTDTHESTTDPTQGTTGTAPCDHSWADATCTEAKTCTLCGATEGEAAGHTWKDATCIEPKTCTICAATEGDPADHTYENGACTLCQAADPSYPDLTAGDWFCYKPSDDSTGIVFAQLLFSDTGFSYTYDSAFDITDLSEEMQQSLREDEPARLIEYNGKTYVMPRGLFRYTAEFTVEGNQVIVSTEDWDGGNLVLERTAGDQLVVKSVDGFFNSDVGDTFVYFEKEHKHMFLSGGCTEPKYCVGCDATKGEAPGHDFQDGSCNNCGAHALGYGKWENMRLRDDGTLSVVTISFNNNSGSGGVSCSSYVDLSTLSADKQAEVQNRGARIIDYEGKQYVSSTGYGDPCYYEITENIAQVNLGDPGSDWPQKVTLELTDIDEATVTAVSDDGFYGLAVGDVLTYYEG